MIGAFAPNAAKGWREVAGWPFAPHPVLGRPLFGGSAGSRGGRSPRGGGSGASEGMPPSAGGGGSRITPAPRPLPPLVSPGARLIPRVGPQPITFPSGGIGAMSNVPSVSPGVNVPPGSRVSPSGIANPVIPAPRVNVPTSAPAPVRLPRHPNFGRFNQMDGAETWMTDPGFHREPENEAFGGERPAPGQWHTVGRPNDVLTRPPAYDATQPGARVGSQVGVRPGKVPGVTYGTQPGPGPEIALGTQSPPDQGLTLSTATQLPTGSGRSMDELLAQAREVDEYNRRMNPSYAFYGVNTPEMYEALQRQSMATWGRASPLVLL